MSHREYLKNRSQRDPRFASELQVVAAEAALGETVVRRREDLALTLAQLATETGIAEERLEAIEAGASMTLHEVLWLLHSLGISVSIGPDFDLIPQVPVVTGALRRVAT